jgi:hypothetical protein
MAVMVANALVANVEQLSQLDAAFIIERLLRMTISGLIEALSERLLASSDFEPKRSAPTADDIISVASVNMDTFHVCCQSRARSKALNLNGHVCSVHNLPLLSFPNPATVVWKHHLGQCIDASVLVVSQVDKPEGLVIVGSHSKKLVCLVSTTGNLVWSTDLPDRIESSALLSKFEMAGFSLLFMYLLGV